jgi:hypothetical protein
MAKRRPASIAIDFAEVVAYLQSRPMMSASTAGMPDHIRALHRATHSLILWRFRLPKLPEQSAVFLEEIASDALQILPQVSMGFSKPARLLLRGITENVLRHVYFSDHPVEFTLMNSSERWYLSVTELFEYAKKHPLFATTEPSFDALGRLQGLYDELSAVVHGRSVRDFQMNVALSKIDYQHSVCEKESRLAIRCSEAVNFLLASFHVQKFRHFSPDDRKTILQTMPAKAKNLLVSL